MSRKQKTKRVLIAVLLAAVLGGGLWYSRPVDIYGLLPELEAKYLYVYLVDFSDMDGLQQYRLDLNAEDPRYEEVLKTLEALRFRRIPLGQLWNWFDRQTGEIVYSPYEVILNVDDAEHHLMLEYRDDWEYTAGNNGTGSRNYNVSLVGGEEATQALTDYLLTIAEETP